MQFDYQNDRDNSGLSDEQKQEIIKQDNDFVTAKTTARNWEDIKRDLKSVYR